MIAYFAVQDKNINFDKISWSNTLSLSHDPEQVREQQKQWWPDGMVLKVDMDDKDVIQAVLSCMHGNSCTVKVKVLAVA